MPEAFDQERFSFEAELVVTGDPYQCRLNAAHCLALSRRAWRPEVRQAFSDLAKTWNRLAAETESDQALYRAISEIEFGEPYEELPRALHLCSWAA
jgi:ABC-type nitrate/sulfonate/bicarbonate transport system substrate-binding protein